MLCNLVLSQSTTFTILLLLKSASPLRTLLSYILYKWWLLYLNMCKQYLSQKLTIISLSGMLDMYYQSFLTETLSLLSLSSLTLSQPSKLVPFHLPNLLFECLCGMLKSVYSNPRSLYFLPNSLSLFQLMTALTVDQVLTSRFILDYYFTFTPQIQCVSKCYFSILPSKYIQNLTVFTSSTAIFFFFLV